MPEPTINSERKTFPGERAIFRGAASRIIWVTNATAIEKINTMSAGTVTKPKIKNMPHKIKLRKTVHKPR